MRILYAYEKDATSRRTQSGRPNSIYTRMLAAGHEVDLLTIPPSEFRKPRAKQILYRALGRRYGGERTVRNSRIYADFITTHVASVPRSYDVIFSPSTLPFAHLELPIPKVACADTLFADLMDTYPQFSNVARAYRRDGDAHERLALSRLDLLVVPSEAARDCAIGYYGMSPSRVLRHPWGGNLGQQFEDAELDRAVDERVRSGSLDFVFVGKDWHRKNGQLVARTVAALNAAGIPSTGHFIGPPPDAIPADLRGPGILTYGDVDLTSAEGARRLFDISRGCAFFFVPSLAEAYGMAFSEGAAIALPLLGTAVGGIRDIITPETGFRFRPNAGPDEVVAEIVPVWRDKARYRAMAEAVREDSRRRLNWDSLWRALEAGMVDIVRRRAA
jgi:glycosyltransferase involved in cell wall biosynthesis